MAFDRSNPTHLAALKSEVLTDPIAMGYVSGNTGDVLSRLNDPALNVGGDTGADFLTPKNLLNVLFGEAISSQDQFKIQLVFESASTIDDDISIFRDDLSALGVGLATAIGTITRSLSRGEVLFGALDANGSYEKVYITREDWLAARDS